MPNVFISYAREDTAFVRRLYDALGRADVKAWVDWEGIPPAGEWLLEIERAIDAANACIFILSPDSHASEVCRVELAYAVEQKKRLIPIVHRDADAAAIAPELAKLNWIFAREQDDFERATAALVSAIDTDLEWVRNHSVLLQKAREWHDAKRPSSYTVRGEELARYEKWLTEKAPRDLMPTPLQTEFLLESRRYVTRRQRQLFGGSSAAALALVFLGTFGYFQSRERARQATIAEARQLVNQSESLRDAAPETPDAAIASLSAGVEALRLLASANEVSVDADLAVRRSMALLPASVEVHDLNLHNVQATASDPAGRFLAIANGRNQLTVWDALNRRVVAQCGDTLGASVRHAGIAVSSDGETLITLTHDAGTGTASLTARRIPVCNVIGRHDLARANTDQVRVSPDGRIAGVVALRAPILVRVDSSGLAPIEPPLDADAVLDITFPSDGASAMFLTRARGTRTYALVAFALNDGAFGAQLGAMPLPQRPEVLRAGPAGDLMYVAGDSLYRLGPGLTDGGAALIGLDLPVVDHWASSPQPVFVARITRLDQVRTVWVDFLATGAVIDSLRLDHPAEVLKVIVPPAAVPTVVTLSDGAIRTWTIVGGSAILEARAFAPGERPGFLIEAERILAVTDTAAVAVTLPRDAMSQDATLAVLDRAAVMSVPSAPLQANVTGEDPFRRTTISLRRAQATEEWVLDNPVRGAAASPDGDRIAVLFGRISRGGWQRRLVVFDAMSRDSLAAATLPPVVGDSAAAWLAYSPDGRFLVNRTAQGFEARDVRTLDPVFELFHADAHGIALQPAGPLAATSDDESTRVWDMTTGLEVARVEHDGSPATEEALSTDGNWMLTAHKDGSLRLWAISTQALIAQACRSLGDRCATGA